MATDDVPPPIIVFTCKLSSIVAVDMNPAENALLEFKIAAIKHLNYEDYLLVLGDKEDTEQKRYTHYSIGMHTPLINLPIDACL